MQNDGVISSKGLLGLSQVASETEFRSSKGKWRGITSTKHCRFFDQNLRGIFLYENGYIFQIKCTPNKCCHTNPGGNHFFSKNIHSFFKKEQNCDFSKPVCSKFKGIFSLSKWAYISY